jgi:tRNA modification GTPase
MSKAAYGSSDPIAAIATPAGESALAVIRISGAGSIALLSTVFSRPGALREAAGNTVVYGWVCAPPGAGERPEAGEPLARIDEVLAAVYRAPRSYTGEEGADLSCHGGSAAARAVLAALRAAGFREALRGEFSFRAFMNGKLDLTRAESVMEIVSAKTDRGREHAVERLSGVLEAEIKGVQALLVAVLAGAELFLDYSEDEAGGAAEDEKAGILPGREGAEEALTRLRALAGAWRRERLYQEGARVVIAGRPNAGKSSLFNLLLREERSIVTDIPGTTRDWIEAWIALAGIPVRLADTAGLRDIASPEQTVPAAMDPVERIGITRSRELLERADLILYVIDGAAGLTGEDRDFLERYAPDEPPGTAEPGNAKRPPVLAVWNKADIASPPPLAAKAAAAISAKTGAGIGELCDRIAGMLEAAAGGSGTATEAGGTAAAPGTLRQKELVDEALAAVTEALALADRGEPLDLIAPAIREGINALGEITGEVSTADILEAMFSTFCLGK